MTKKSVSFDELEGGAIRADTRVFESAAPAQEDFTTVMRNPELYQFEGDPAMHYREAFDMIPKNIYPMFMYDHQLRAQDHIYPKDAILAEASGHGVHKDANHIQKAVVHSLKQYPKLLNMYLNHSNLIL